MIEIKIKDKITREEVEDYEVAGIFGGDTAHIDYTCRSDMEGFMLDCDGVLWLLGDGNGKTYPIRVPADKYIVQLTIWGQDFTFGNR